MVKIYYNVKEREREIEERKRQRGERELRACRNVEIYI